MILEETNHVHYGFLVRKYFVALCFYSMVPMAVKAFQRLWSPRNLTPAIGTLVNVGGNGCFVNASLQLLSSSAHFRSFCSRSGSSILKEIEQFLVLLNTSNQVLNPRSLISTLYASFQLPSLHGQQDAHEFLIQLLSQLESLMCREQGGLIRRLAPYELLFASTVRCGTCSYASPLRISSHSIIHVTLSKSIQASLHAFSNWEHIESSCSGCGQPTLSSKVIPLRSPKVLLIHINRVSYSRGFFSKLSDRTKVDLLVKFNGRKYRLKSWIEHSGGPSSGHYFTIKHHNGSWYKISDQECSLYTIKDQEQPYLCLYEHN